LKSLIKCLALMLIIAGIGSCSNKENIRDEFFQGIYDVINQQQEMKHPDQFPPSGKEAPTYDQYMRERKEILTNPENNQQQ
jgi:hypothetical protein